MSTLKSQKRSTFLKICFAICLLTISAATAEAATYTVTNTNDSGPGSLRQAIIDSNDSADNDTIEFALSGCPCVITLTSGRLSISNNGTLTINGPGANQLSVSGNKTGRVFFVDSGAVAEINGLTVTGGSVSGFLGGGGIGNFGGTLTLTNSTVSSNWANNDGGGILNSGMITLINSTVSGNSAQFGGGIMNFGTMTVTNSTVSSNWASNDGGGISSRSLITMKNSTISNNQAGVANGGISIRATATLINTIIANSTNGDCGTDADGTINASYSIIEGGLGCVNGTNLNNLTGDPMLDELAYNGGPTTTHALLPGSPAIDAGGPTDLTTDQRGSGFARTIDDPNVVNAAGSDGTDIGAVESNFITVNTTAEHNDGACQPLSVGDCTLREAILAANAVAGTETIIFDIPTTDPGYDSVADRYTITLTSVLPDLDSDMSIIGLGAKRLTVNRGGGGAFRIFHIKSGATVSIFGLTIAGGLATEGGGIRNDGSLSIAGSVVRDNLTLNGQNSCTVIASGNAGPGGGIYNGGFLMVDSSTFMGNRTGNGGAGINNSTCSRSAADGGHGGAIGNFGTVVVRNSTFSGNRTGDGGAMAFQSPPPGFGGLGAAIYNSGSLSISNTTINANQPGFRGVGSVVSSTEVELTSSIVANTVGSNDIRGHFNGDFNLVGTLVVGSTLTGTNNITSLDPILGPLADNGGPTPTHAPLCGSPSIDAGENVSGFATDQRGFGFARTFDDLAVANAADGDGTDIGAFELQEAAVCNTAPVANDDSYSTDEDTIREFSAPGVLGNDTDGENDPLTAALVDGPANGTLTFRTDGSFRYTPNPNFNGTDSFTYKANDGSLDSNVATVTITVNSVNDIPMLMLTPSHQSVQYSDAIASVAVTAWDPDAASLSVSTEFLVGAGGAFEPGLPAGLTISSLICTPWGSGVSCTTSLTGTANVPAGTYTIRFTGSDGELSAFVHHTLTVTKEHTETEYTGDVYALTAGPTVTTANVRLAAQLTQQADGYPGDITKAKVSFLLFKGGNLGSTPDLTVSGVPVDGSGAAITFANLPVDTWTVKVKIDADNGYWKASLVGMSTITIEQPTTELRTSGGGWVADGESVNGKGNFGFNVANQKKGVRGSSVYLFRGLDGFNYLVKSTSWNSGGIGFRREGNLTSLASFSGKCVVQKIDPATGDVVESFGNYSFTVDVRDGDLFNPRQPDKYAITILNGAGLVWRQIGAPNSPLIIGGGNVTVKGK